jgi:nicotinic acid mononucleotide adenylyltransferase
MDFEISSSKVRLEIETALFDPNKIDDSVINYINKNNLYSKSI